MVQIRAAIFDAYGTLLHIHAAMPKHAVRLDPDWPQINAASRHGISDKADLVDVLTAYRCLASHAEVPAVQRQIRDRELPRAVWSNGESSRLADAVRSANLQDLLNFVLSVEEVGVFKPDQRVYRQVRERLDLLANQIALVSPNPWEASGFQAFWINRTGQRAKYDPRDVVTELIDFAVLPCALSMTSPRPPR
jgi:2-haloacid dehalogenase